ncbi:GMC oxidoreductase [Mycolicibacterium sp. CBMA 226]|uniref:GMC oxidoreductase n=1 Tax=Mycolicibacterium sp. CBMA 226 TaxID=2606611 RepID=UPI0012DC8352|nr:GMC family oxidoreductase [Mycolicibacterium sp. CBMA 226]MUL78704.1 GMC family oxidoreductase [Mycolicibacterium sp. CBMA 226]
MAAVGQGHDYDWIVIGSGFGGSVSALRLSERGYSVCVLESGRRFASTDLPTSGWKVRDLLFAPRLGLRGIMRMSLFRDVAILSGAGVGGGSLVYGATLYRGSEEFQSRLTDAVGEHVDLDPHYREAERMLGVVDNPRLTPRDAVVKRAADRLGYGETCHPTRVGIFLGQPGVTVPDPFFGGQGPDRTGCLGCAECLIGCRHNAKNSLDKNYLWLAERRGTRVEPEMQVSEVRPVGAADGSDGYAIVAHRPGVFGWRKKRVIRSRGVVFAAGAIGTNKLLGDCKVRGMLPLLSDQVGEQVRTNSESLTALTPRDRNVELGLGGVSITGSAHPLPSMHMETVAFGSGGDSMKFLFAPLTPNGTRVTRPLKMLAAIVRHPIDAARVTNPVGWSRRSMVFGAMQDIEGKLSFETRKRRLGLGTRMNTRPDPLHPIPTFIPEVHEAIKLMAEELDAVPQTLVPEALLNTTVTAHILGGAVIGTSPDNSVIDGNHQVWGYRNMLVCDGSTVPWNVGANPSLTIAAMTERAMSTVPVKSAEPAGSVSEQLI